MRTRLAGRRALGRLAIGAVQAVVLASGVRWTLDVERAILPVAAEAPERASGWPIAMAGDGHVFFTDCGFSPTPPFELVAPVVVAFLLAMLGDAPGPLTLGLRRAR